MKHAYLIIAHTDWELLRTLIKCIDDERNDVFVHIDAKVKVIPELRTEKAGLFVLKNRIDVRWGDVSQIQTELNLFSAARSQGEFAYYHLLSGVDLPLKTQDYIHSFFEHNQGKQFVGYTEQILSELSYRKVHRYHIFSRSFRSRNLLIRIIRAGCLRVQERFDIRRNESVEFKKGSNWISITTAFVDYILANREWIMSVFHHTFCGDEFFIQTLCWNSPFSAMIYDSMDDGRGCMRAIGWKDGCLHDWTAADYETLAASDALFARKFNSGDMEFVNRIAELSK